MGSVLGSILDPAADKALMTTLVVTLTVRGMVPCTYTHVRSLRSPIDTHGIDSRSTPRHHNLGKGCVIELISFLDTMENFTLPGELFFGHIAWGIWWLNHISKKTFQRYWDFSLPSAEVQPTFISKV